MRISFIGMVLSLLVGCASVPPDAQLAASCQAYATTLSSLAELRMEGSLSSGQIESVNSAVAIVGPICKSPAEAGRADLMTVSRMLRNLSEIEQEAK